MGFATPPFSISTMTIGGNDPIVYREPEPCRRHHGRRMGIGPTGRKRFMVIADVCYACGYIMQTYGKLSWQQQDWVRRSNARIEAVGEGAANLLCASLARHPKLPAFWQA